MKRAALLSTIAISAAIFGETGETGEAFAQCVHTTDCASLGYTETSCPNGGLKCPFGTTWSCKGANTQEIIWGGCSGAAPNCEIGQILNSDGSCSNNKISGKTPYGVVVYIDGDGCGQAIALTNTPDFETWSNSRTDLSNLVNYTNEDSALNDYDSCGNTDIILTYIDINKMDFPAAIAVRNYIPAGTSKSKGKWCLPSAGIFNSINNHRTKIDTALTEAGGSPFETTYANYWTSSEHSAKGAWSWNSESKKFWDNAPTYNSGGKDDSYYKVRPVINF